MTRKTIFEWAELFQEDISSGASQSDIIQMLEDYKTEQLILSGVSLRRELLLAYHKHLDSFNDPTIYNASESMIDDYLANNCG
jgi:hypothetical protein